MSPPSALRHRLLNGAWAITVALLLLYPLDWAAWRLRVTGGGGMQDLPVTETTAATLKGNRFEVYSQQSTTVSCSRSLLPQAGAGPCWWIRRHPQIVRQY